MLKIKNAEDFGLGFNCMSRLYMDGYDEEILDDMIAVSKEYLKWFSQRTIVCSLRDLVIDYPLGWNEGKIPENQEERYENMIKDLIRQGVTKEREESRYLDDRSLILRFGNDFGVISSSYGKEKKFTLDSFYEWVVDNKLNEVVEMKMVKAEALPVKKKFLPTFYKLCKYMVYYSYGRHTYMPSTSRDFVKKNMELISDSNLEDILAYLQEKNANIPEHDALFYEMDNENWLHMQEDIECELTSRRMFCAGKEKYVNSKQWKAMLEVLLDFTMMQTQKDCIHKYYQVIGVERYLKTLLDEETRAQRALRQLEKGKNEIIKKRWEYFKKEEGDKYEKISDGVYRKKQLGRSLYMYQTIDQIRTGIKLKLIIKQAGYDVKYIQDYLQFSCPQSIYRWFKGKALPSVENLCALSQLLNVHMEELLVLQGESILGDLAEGAEDSELKRLLAYADCFQKAA